MEGDLRYEDYDGDGWIDIGAPLKTGAILWYTQGRDEYDEVRFAFAEVQPASVE